MAMCNYVFYMFNRSTPHAKGLHQNFPAQDFIYSRPVAPHPARSNVNPAHFLTQCITPIFFASAHCNLPRHRRRDITRRNSRILLTTIPVGWSQWAISCTVPIQWRGCGLSTSFIDRSSARIRHRLCALRAVPESDGDIRTPSGWCLLLGFRSPGICW